MAHVSTRRLVTISATALGSLGAAICATWLALQPSAGASAAPHAAVLQAAGPPAAGPPAAGAPASGSTVSSAPAPAPSRDVPITQSVAEAFARRAVGAAPDATTFAAYMTGSTFMRDFGEQRSTNIDESRPVWVVTVHTPVVTDGGPAVAGQRKDYYSIVIDAVTGRGTDDCLGCDWVTGQAR